MLEVQDGGDALQTWQVTGMGYDGQLPKLDLFMLAEHSLSRVAGFATALASLSEGAAWGTLAPKPLQAAFKQVAGAAGSVVPGGWDTPRYGAKLLQLWAFVAQQAAGLPQGAHAPCKRYGIDAVTVRTSPSTTKVRTPVPWSCGHMARCTLACACGHESTVCRCVALRRIASNTGLRKGHAVDKSLSKLLWLCMLAWHRHGIHVPVAMQTGGATSTRQLKLSAMAVESFFRSCNSLLERLHHSYFMYLQPSTSTFVTVDAYIVPPLLLIAAMLLWAAHLLVQPAQSMASPRIACAEGGPYAARAGDDVSEDAIAASAQHKNFLRQVKAKVRAKLGMRDGAARAELFPATAEPLRLRATLAQFGSCFCAAVLLHVLCAGVAPIARAAVAARLDSGLVVDQACSAAVAFSGLAVTLWQPAKGLLCSSRGSTQPSSTHVRGSTLQDWQAYKACALLNAATLLAGALFVNWCALSSCSRHLKSDGARQQHAPAHAPAGA